MNVEGAIALVNRFVYQRTQKHLSDLQQVIIIRVCQRKTYLEIADEYGCTEGHAKDTGSLLWQLLSEAWGKKVTKSNFRSLINQELQLLGDAEININQNINPSLRDLAIPEVTGFLGRQTAIATINNLISQDHKIIVLQGEGGIGKTTLAQRFLADHGFEVVLEVLVAISLPELEPIGSKPPVLEVASPSIWVMEQTSFKVLVTVQYMVVQVSIHSALALTTKATLVYTLTIVLLCLS